LLRVVDPAFDALFLEIHGLQRMSSVVLPGGLTFALVLF